MTHSLRSLLLLSSCILGLAGCQGGASSQNTPMSEADIVDRALTRAADQIAARDITPETLQVLEKVYKRNPQDPQAAMRYARGLRELGESTKAAIILAPFAEDINSAAALKLEYAASELENGKYDLATEAARDALKQAPESGYAYHLLGTALDAQGLHEQSEKAFRNALTNWSGDPVPVMNNLALSLAAQHKLDEAVDLLEQAKSLDPNRLEIERNLRIVNALKETFSYEPSAGRNE